MYVTTPNLLVLVSVSYVRVCIYVHVCYVHTCTYIRKLPFCTYVRTFMNGIELILYINGGYITSIDAQNEFYAIYKCTYIQSTYLVLTFLYVCIHCIQYLVL